MSSERPRAGSVAPAGEGLSRSGLSPVGALVRRHDPDRFLICLFVPAALREAALVLAAFNHELARAVEVVSRRPSSGESGFAARIRLQWWREILEGARRPHEVAGPLGALLDDGTVAPASLASMIDARETEIEGPGTEAAWWSMLAGGPGALAATIAQLGGDAGAGAIACAAASGQAYGAGASLLHAGALRDAGRRGLPDTVELDTVETPRRLAAEALQHLRDSPRPRLSGPARAAALHAVLARRDLARVGGPAQAPGRGVGDRLAVLTAALFGGRRWLGG